MSLFGEVYPLRVSPITMNCPQYHDACRKTRRKRHAMNPVLGICYAIVDSKTYSTPREDVFAAAHLSYALHISDEFHSSM